MKTITKFKNSINKKRPARRVKENPIPLSKFDFLSSSVRLPQGARPDLAFLSRSYGNRFFVSTGIGGYMITSIKFTPKAVLVDNFFDAQEKL